MVRLIRGIDKKTVLINALASAPADAMSIRFGKRLSATAWLMEYDPSMDGYSIYQLMQELGLHIPARQEKIISYARPGDRLQTQVDIREGKVGFILQK